MVHGTSKLQTSADTLQSTLNGMRHQVTISANMITTTIGVFGIGYFVGTKLTDQKSHWMICGLISAMGILIVEMTLYIIRASKQDDLHSNMVKENKKKEDELRIVNE